MAKIAYELFTHPRMYPDWQIYAQRLGEEIDWRKTAPIWQNNIISSGKSFSNKGPLIKAVEAVKNAIGMQRASKPISWSWWEPRLLTRIRRPTDLRMGRTA